MILVVGVRVGFNLFKLVVLDLNFLKEVIDLFRGILVKIGYL